MTKLNLLGQPLEPCSMEPLTGFYRDGLCRTDSFDKGHHVVCAQVTEAFLDYTKSKGNDLSTPIPGSFQDLNRVTFGACAHYAGLRPFMRVLPLKSDSQQQIKRF